VTLPAHRIASLYDSFAEYYDLWTGLKPAAQGDADYFLRQATLAPGGGPVVELGVGTGRIAAAFAAAGHHVVGVDLSQAMLDRARDRMAQLQLTELVDLVLGDMVTWRPPDGVQPSVVLCPYHSLAHLLDLRDLRAALRNVHGYIADDGVFAFTLAVPDQAALQRTSGLWVDDGEIPLGEATAHVRTRSTHDWGEAWETVEVHGELRSGDDVLLERDWAFTLRLLPVDEVRRLVTDAGFEIESLSGSFGPEVTSPVSEQNWVLRKGTAPA
jgi:SAM-dependent methyltransferase